MDRAVDAEDWRDHRAQHHRRGMSRALEMDRVAPVLDFIKQDINQGNGAVGWVERAKVAGFSDEDISEAIAWLGRARQYLDDHPS
jgi:hypothetical protein